MKATVVHGNKLTKKKSKKPLRANTDNPSMSRQFIHHKISFLLFTACTVSNQQHRQPTGDASVDGPMCTTVDMPLRCDGMNLVRCGAVGTSEVKEMCSFGCNAAELRCADLAPSNGLAKFLDAAKDQPDVNLGDAATINTDSGDIMVGSKAIAVSSETVTQPDAPMIRVLMVHSLTAKDVVVTGNNALAILSSGDIVINGVFTASANGLGGGPGAFYDSNCKGQDAPSKEGEASGGAGGGGFGSRGGSGGSGRAGRYSSEGGKGGMAGGNVSLVPLRGGCVGGANTRFGTSGKGGGAGGALQLVSQTRISVTKTGAVAANGAGMQSGGSGGGILLEAPIVDVAGAVVANGGGAWGGALSGESGRLDDKPAMGGFGYPSAGYGGDGAAGTIAATDGQSISLASDSDIAYAGGGGGGVGRIRVNTAAGGQHTTGVYSPDPNPGPLGTR